MKQYQTNKWFQPVWATLLVLILLLAITSPAHAQGIVFGDGVPAGEEVNQDIILVGTDVNIDGNVHGDVLALGQNVRVNGVIDGSMVTGGQSVTIDGQVGGSAYVAALEQKLGTAAQIARNLYFAGLLLSLPPGSEIKNNLYMATVLSPSMQGTVGGDVKSVGPADLVRFIYSLLGNEINLPWLGPVQIKPGAWRMEDSFVQSSLVAPASISFSAGNLISKGMSAATQTPALDTARLQKIILNWLRQYLTLLIFALLAIWLAPPYLTQTGETVHNSVWKSAGWGLVAILVGYTGILLFFLLILALGAFLIYLTLYGLGLITISLGLGLLGVAFTLFTLLVNYVSKVIVAFLTGYLILYRKPPERSSWRIFSALLGLLIYTVLAEIPFLGWVIAMLATLLGMGALWMVFVQRRASAEAEPAVAPIDAGEQVEPEGSAKLPSADEVAGSVTVSPQSEMQGE